MTTGFRNRILLTSGLWRATGLLAHADTIQPSTVHAWCVRAITSRSVFRDVELPDIAIGRNAGMAELIVNVLVEIVTDIWTLQCLARWRRKKAAAQETASDQRSD
ncbi:hypothetical protein JQ616_39145 [Bradyrhizobium tropiciagri]|uniref:hypothetical protein n=1 Tax=Bradyrhizobium tropiciagri TaxID=312253 RepID=UPI001BA5FF7E|nr:hypothetical protein [Bradyrhizobium tropiciagri]MBR0901009.1 hypothetical protein [Bradyrhizobium tropiciagri]